MTTTLPTAACPDCAQPTVTTGLGRPWCPSCDWNLDATVPVFFGWGWLDRRLHRVAVRLNDAQFAALADGPLTPGTTTAARLTTMAAAVLLLAGVLAVAVLGVWLVVADFFSVSTVLGVVLLGVAYFLRPRLGRLSALVEDRARLEPAQAPQLFALVERVAVAVGAPTPQVLILGYDLNAFTTTVGLRRTRVLSLGLPLQLLLVWTSQRDSQRAEYLADEIGARAGGTEAAIGLADHGVFLVSIDTVVRREARAGNGMAAWYQAAQVARVNLAAGRPVLRRLSRHIEASLNASHPPAGLRAEMLERRPRQDAAVTLSEVTAAAIDQELAGYQKRAVRELRDQEL